MTTHVSARLRKAAHNRLAAKRYAPHKRPKLLTPRHRTIQSTLCRCTARTPAPFTVPGLKLFGRHHYSGCNCTRSIPVALILETSPTRSALTCGPCKRGRHQSS